MKPNFIDNLVILLFWYLFLCFSLLFACFAERILRYFVNRKLLNLKCLDSKHIR